MTLDLPPSGALRMAAEDNAGEEIVRLVRREEKR